MHVIWLCNPKTNILENISKRGYLKETFVSLSNRLATRPLACFGEQSWEQPDQSDHSVHPGHTSITHGSISSVAQQSGSLSGWTKRKDQEIWKIKMTKLSRKEIPSPLLSVAEYKWALESLKMAQKSEISMWDLPARRRNRFPSLSELSQ